MALVIEDYELTKFLFRMEFEYIKNLNTEIEKIVAQILWVKSSSPLARLSPALKGKDNGRNMKSLACEPKLWVLI